MHLKQQTLKLLQSLGFTPSEAALYLSALRQPGQSIKDLRKKARLSSSSAYRAFESLKNRGLVLPSLSHWAQAVYVAPFKKLRAKLVHEQIVLKKMELRLKEVEDLMELSALANVEEPVEILFNKNDIQEKADQLLYKGQDRFLVYGSGERLVKIIDEDFERQFIRNRVKKGITAEVCFTELGEFTNEFIPRSKKELRPLKINLDCSQEDHMTYIFEDEAVRWQFDEELGARAIVMRDPALVKMCAEKFKNMWNSA